MRVKISLLFIVTLICINVIGQNENEKKKLVEDNYSISYPSDWELNKSGQMGSSFILFSPVESNQDIFRENINLLIQDLSNYNIDLDKFVEISKGQIKTMVKNGNLLKSERINTDSDEFHKVIYTGDQDIYKLKFQQYYWVKKQKAYILTLTCEKHQFDSYQKIGVEILNSFKLK